MFLKNANQKRNIMCEITDIMLKCNEIYDKI